MSISNLPSVYLNDMKKILGSEYEDFLDSYSRPCRKALRINTLKLGVRDAAAFAEEFGKEAGFRLTPVPWTQNGFYFEEEDQPSRHSFYSAGLYYLQEASAMAPAQILPVSPGEAVLDLCAAPGGKATELGARLQGQGLLVANEISAPRARILMKNLELFGIPNACVTNTEPVRLLERYPAFFDRILVDAPCSGEGMFRKDMAVAQACHMCGGYAQTGRHDAVFNLYICPAGKRTDHPASFERASGDGADGDSVRRFPTVFF